MPALRILLTALIGALSSPAAFAQQDSVVVNLSEVLVRGTRPIAAPGGSGAITARIDSLPVPPNACMDQVLRALPGVYSRVNSRGEVEVTVRGSESRQVAILLDGIPLTLAWDGRADVSVLPALAARDVVLIRGLSTLMHGPNTLGGVVEFRTRPVDPRLETPAAEIGAAVDQLGGFTTAASISAPHDLGWGVFTARAGIGLRDSPGQPLARRVSEPLSTEEDLRRNTDLRQSDGFLTLQLDAERGAFVALTGVGHEAERGIAAQLGVTSARFWRYPHIARGIGILSAGTGGRHMPWGGEAAFEVSAGLDRGRTEIDAYDSGSYTTVASEEDGNDDVRSLRAVATQSLGNNAHVRLGVTHADVRHDEILSGTLNLYRQRLWSVAGETAIRVAPRVDVSAGATFDAADTPETGNKPSHGDLDRWGGRLGLSAAIGSGATVAHASVSQRARFPSLRELYSGSLGSFDPNPNLRPEHLLGVEAGVTSRHAQAVFQVVGFYHLLSDAVVRIRPPGSNFQRVNQEGIRSVGAELLGSRAFGRLEVSADLVAQNVEVLDPAAGLTRPENMPEIMANARLGVTVAPRTQLTVDARFLGDQFVIDPETSTESKLAAAGRLSIGASRGWGLGSDQAWFRSLEVRTVIENVTDAPQFEAFGLPLPGRSLRLELRLHH